MKDEGFWRGLTDSLSGESDCLSRHIIRTPSMVLSDYPSMLTMTLKVNLAKCVAHGQYMVHTNSPPKHDQQQLIPGVSVRC